MIESAHIQNCQSHKDTFIEFHSGVNVIVGDTDSGKSALLRSLRYAIWNQKISVSHWGGVRSVSLKVDENIITRKSDGKEIYLLNDLEFKSFGVNPPDEIKAALNMDEVNSQEQIETFFLLTETSGYVASYLNKIANIEQIDSVTASIKSELNEARRVILHKKEDLKNKEAELTKFDFLTEFKEAIIESEVIELKINEIAQVANILKDSENKIKKWNAEIEDNKNLVDLKPTIDTALTITLEIKELMVKQQKLNWFYGFINDIDTEIADLTKLSSISSSIKEAVSLKKKQSDLQAKLERMQVLNDKILSIDTKLDILQSEINKDKEIYETELHKLGKCFFCGSKIK